MKDLKQLEKFYEDDGKEELRLQESSPQYIEFLVATKYLSQSLPPSARILDSCAGTGVYAFYLAEQGHRVTAGDVVRRNVEILRTIQEKSPLLAGVYEGDALDLSRFPPGSFDAVLCMGALYHLHAPADRRLVVEESLRLLPEGGLFACTYMNRYAVILNNMAGSLDNIGEVLEFVQRGVEGIFYASTPEETAGLMGACGLEPVCHVALDGMAAYLRESAGILDDTGLRRWRDYHLAVCEVPSLLGSSYHNLFIGRKRGR